MKKTLVPLLTLALLLSGCGAKGGDDPQTETTAPEMTTEGTTEAASETTAPETTTTETATTAATTAAATTTAAPTPAAYFERGVYEVYVNGASRGDYYLFYDKKSGKTINTSLGISTGFSCEQSDGRVVFHRGSTDQTEILTMEESSDIRGMMGDSAYTFKLKKGVDPDTFDGEESAAAAPAPAAPSAPASPDLSTVPHTYFSSGVYEARAGSGTRGYYCFYDEEGGRFVSADGTSGIAFTCEQMEGRIVFHMGSVEDSSSMSMSDTESGLSGTIDGTTLSFFYMWGADPATYTPGNE